MLNITRYLLGPLILILPAISCQQEITRPIQQSTAAIPPPVPEDFYCTEQRASFPGGEQALMQFLTHHIDVPEDALARGFTGRLTMKFIVKKDGRINTSSMTINEQPLDTLNFVHQIGYKLVKAMPEWIPAKQGNMYVAEYYQLPLMVCITQKE